MPRAVLMADPRMRTATAVLAVACVVIMSVLIVHTPETNLSQEAMSSSVLGEV